MNQVKKELINNLFDRYWKLEQEDFREVNFKEMLKIDRILGELGVYSFEIEGNVINVKMIDGTSFKKVY